MKTVISILRCLSGLRGNLQDERRFRMYFNELWRIFRPNVLRWAYKYRCNGLSYEELISEGRYGLWDAVARWSDSGKSGYDSDRACVSYINKWMHGRIVQFVKLFAFNAKLTDECEDVINDRLYVDFDIRKHVIVQEVMRCKDARIVWMKVNGFTFSEIGRVYGISAQSAYVRYRAALKRMRQYFKKKGMSFLLG